MEEQKTATFFDKDRAASYDKDREKLAAIKDAMHLLIRMTLSELPAEARVLCMGVGTGAELIKLAEAYPGWRFTAVEPAAPMLDVCRKRTEELGIAERCTFHEGYLDSLPESEPFDAATSILVSHFILAREERRNYYRQIKERLNPQGILVSADLSADTAAPGHGELYEVWLRAMEYSGMSEEQLEKHKASFSKAVSVLPPREMEELIASAGFGAPVLFYQSLLIHAWFAKPG